MRKMKKLWCRLIAQTIVGGRHHEAGELLQPDSNTYRQLLADNLAVPIAGPLQPALQTDKSDPSTRTEP